jgi:hypothetical protein
VDYGRQLGLHAETGQHGHHFEIGRIGDGERSGESVLFRGRSRDEVVDNLRLVICIS